MLRAREVEPIANMPPDFSIDSRSFERFSFVDVLNGEISAKQFRGKKVIVGVSTIELGDIISSANQAAADILGAEKAEIVGTSIAVFSPELVHDGIDAFLTHRRAVTGGIKQRTAYRDSGDSFPADVVVAEASAEKNRLVHSHHQRCYGSDNFSLTARI